MLTAFTASRNKPWRELAGLCGIASAQGVWHIRSSEVRKHACLAGMILRCVAAGYIPQARADEMRQEAAKLRQQLAQQQMEMDIHKARVAELERALDQETQVRR